MASNIKMAVATINSMLNGLTTAAGASCTLNIYSGTQPATGDTALSGNTLGASLTMNATFAPGASSGVLTLNSITNANASATITAAFFRILQSNGTTKVLDGTVGTSGADMNLNTVSLVSGAAVSVTSAAFTGGNA